MKIERITDPARVAAAMQRYRDKISAQSRRKNVLNSGNEHVVPNLDRSEEPEEESLDIPRDRRGGIRWQVLKQEGRFLETVEDLAWEFTKNGNRLTHRSLRRAKMRSFLGVISKDYPQGFEGLREVLRRRAEANPSVATEDGAYPPGVELDNKGKMRWRDPRNTEEQNLNLGIKNVQILFLHAFQEFNELFPRDSRGLIDKTKIEQAKQFILDRLGTRQDFVAALGNAQGAPYFEESHYVAIQKTFAGWGLEFPEFDRKVDPKSGEFIDDSGESWVAISYFGIDPRATSYYPKDVRKIKGRDRNGTLTELYSKLEVQEKILPQASLPKVDAKSGFYTDDEGLRWATVKQLVKVLNLSEPALTNRLQNDEFMQARGGMNRLVRLYREDTARAYVQKLVDLPQVDKSSSMYTDESGMQWVPMNFFRRQWGISASTGLRLFRELRQIQGRDVLGKEVTLYEYDASAQKAVELTSLPRVDQATGRYTDPEGNNWVAIETLHKELGGGYEKLKRTAVEVKSLPGRDRRGGRGVLFDEAEFKRLLAEREKENKEFGTEDANADLDSLLGGGHE